MRRLRGIHRVEYCVADLEGVRNFYREVLGMALVKSGESVCFLRTRGAAHSDVALRRGSANGLAALCLAVRTDADLETLVGVLEQAGQQVTKSEAANRPERVSSFSLRDPDGNAVELLAVPPASSGPASDASFGPRKVGHVVLWTPRVPEMERFYTSLGFTVTDRTHIGMSFLRCNSDHHSLALVRSTARTGIQHVAFETFSTEQLTRDQARLADAGYKCIWGIGRHGPGNNLFSYYEDPAGNLFEIYAELEQVPDDEAPSEVRFWGPEHKGDISGRAGPPPMQFRS